MFGALVGWLMIHLGLKTDTASATGSLHAKVGQVRNDIAAGIAFGEMVASDNLKISSDSSKTKMNTGGTYRVAKEIAVSRTGIVRVSFAAVRVNSTEKTYACLFINDNPVGTVRDSLGGLATYTEDIPVVSGDRIQVCTKGDSTDNGVTITNFRLYWDITTTSAIGGVVTID